MSKSCLSLTLCFIMLSLPLAAFAAGKTAAASPVVRLGYLQSDLHQLAAFTALKKGYFAAEGVQVEVAGIFKAGPEEMSAFAAGGLDLGYVGQAPVTTAVANSAAQVKIIAQANLEGSAVMVRQDSPYKSLADLKGQTAAVPGNSTVQDFLLRKALANAHVKPEEVKIIVVKPPEMITALERKDIDAFIAWEPYPAKAANSGAARVLAFSGALWPHHPCCVVIASDALIKNYPDTVKKLVRAHVRAIKFLRANPEEAVKLGVEFTGMDAAAVQLALKNIKYEFVPDRESEREYVRFLKEVGYIKIADPDAFSRNIIDDSFVKKVMQEK